MNQKTPVEIKPTWSLHPGIVLGRMLDQRGIRQSELAERTGLTPKHVNQIVKRAVGVTPDVAVLLERALDTPPRFWAQVAADWEMYVSEEKARKNLTAFNEWASGFDVSTLIHYGIVDARDGLAVRAEKLLRFFGVASPEAFEQTWIRPRVSFRRSQAFTVRGQNTALWLRLVERSAEDIEVKKFRSSSLKKATEQIPALTNLQVPAGFVAAQAGLAEAGVVLVFVKQVPDTRVSAATWWLDSARPVIGITERNRKPDIFWFGLVHEVGHLLLHPRRTTFLDLDDDKNESAEYDDQSETEADDFAESVLLPHGAKERIARAKTRQELILLATSLKLGLPIVAGQHGHLTNQWHIGGKLRGKITDEDIAELEKISAQSLRPTGVKATAQSSPNRTVAPRHLGSDQG